MPKSVSAREYGFVRPAIDVRIVDRGATVSRSASKGGGLFSTRGGDPWQRIRARADLGIPNHARVASSAQQLAKNSNYLNQLAGRARPYLDIILTELERSGLPTSLALLPEIESRYNPRAVSPMKAAGMWQFMPYTGKQMGLEQNAWYDGRHDVLASTRGAIKYLRELNQTFDGDWALALAAYNAGPARVRSAQQANERAGKATDYWSLNLPAETEAYVPRFLAVNALVQSPERFGQRPPTSGGAAPLTVVAIRQPIELASAATASGLPADTLERLNPGFKKGRVQEGQTAYLLVPSQAAKRLHRHLKKTGGSKQATLAASNQVRDAES